MAAAGPVEKVWFAARCHSDVRIPVLSQARHGYGALFRRRKSCFAEHVGIAYAGTLLSFPVSDAIWLGLIAKSFDRDQLGDLMLPSSNLAVAAIFYPFFAIAIVVLAVRPGLEAGSVWTSIGYGAVLGLAAYGTYDMTNLSTLKAWPVPLSIVDLMSGALLMATASSLGYTAARQFGWRRYFFKGGSQCNRHGNRNQVSLNRGI